MRVLVTGGAGFIGSHLLEELQARSIVCAGLDNFAIGRRDHVPPQVPCFEVDIRDAAAVDRAFQEFAPTHVIHEAALVSVKESVDDPVRDAATNIMGGLNVLDACRRHGVARLIFASTGGTIYGEVPPGERADESWNPRPKCAYAAAKAAFELYLQVYRANYGLASTVLRYANVYGPRQDSGGEAGVVAIFAERLLKGLPVQINAKRVAGDGGCERDYVFVRDIAAATRFVLEQGLDGIFNVATGQGRTTQEILSALAAASGVTPAVLQNGHRTGDLERAVLSPAKLAALGWQPAVSFPDGIRETFAWFRNRR